MNVPFLQFPHRLCFTLLDFMFFYYGHLSIFLSSIYLSAISFINVVFHCGVYFTCFWYVFWNLGSYIFISLSKHTWESSIQNVPKSVFVVEGKKPLLASGFNWDVQHSQKRCLSGAKWRGSYRLTRSDVFVFGFVFACRHLARDFCVNDHNEVKELVLLSIPHL